MSRNDTRPDSTHALVDIVISRRSRLTTVTEWKVTAYAILVANFTFVICEFSCSLYIIHIIYYYYYHY